MEKVESMTMELVRHLLTPRYPQRCSSVEAGVSGISTQSLSLTLKQKKKQQHLD